MATKKFCDLCGVEIEEKCKSAALNIFVTAMAERNQGERAFFAQPSWTIDVCLSCGVDVVAPALHINPLLKGTG